MKVFPVATTPPTVPSFSDDWSKPRAGHAHRGIDIFAVRGAPVLAVDDGIVSMGSDPTGGNVANLRTADASYYYAHLDDWEGSSRSVKAGDVIGYVGMTGNAAGTSPHLHFEMHINGVAVDPYNDLVAAQHDTMSVRSTFWRSLFKFSVIAALGVGGWYAWEHVRGQHATDRERQLPRHRSVRRRRVRRYVG